MTDRDNEHCPNCGRYASEDDGYYAFIAAAPDFISLFCKEACATAYTAKGGKIVDGDYWMTARDERRAARA